MNFNLPSSVNSTESRVFSVGLYYQTIPFEVVSAQEAEVMVSFASLPLPFVPVAQTAEEYCLPSCKSEYTTKLPSTWGIMK